MSKRRGSNKKDISRLPLGVLVGMGNDLSGSTVRIVINKDKPKIYEKQRAAALRFIRTTEGKPHRLTEDFSTEHSDRIIARITTGGNREESE